ncbi:MAG: Na+/H+ antiporter NhaA [Solirubrobacteraceae bacterium]|nr:Na+/H+ antiporter NhaA [Solirubrobacteraceae bacterium]
MRAFLATETGSAGVLLAATLVALVWANSPLSGAYEDLWSARLTIDLAGARLDEDLRHWVNDGLMALFFYVIGLEIRREWAMGELRDRRTAAVPAIAAIGGMIVPALIYTAVNAGGDGAGGWGIVMATDVAFVLGVLALLGSRCPPGVRVFLLTLAIVDDVGAILVIAVFYSHGVEPAWLAVAAAILVAIALGRRIGDWRGPAYAVAGVALWIAVLESGLHPTIAGVALGLLTAVHPPRRADLDRAAALGRVFRRAPTAHGVRAATLQVRRSVSANERFEEVLHPWTSYVIVPLFALANAGVALDGDAIGDALSSPVALGVVAGLVAGKALGIGLFARAAVALRIGPLPGGVAARHLAGAAAVAGIGFTVSLFVAELAFEDDAVLRQEAKLGVLAASVLAAVVGAGLLRRAGPATDAHERVAARLDPPVDPRADHVRGPAQAPLTLTLFGGFACPGTRRAAAVAGELRERLGDRLRVVFRDLPIEDAHPEGPLAAEAAEAAGAQGRYWAMWDALMAAPELAPSDLVAIAQRLGLDVDRFADDLRHRVQADAVAADVDSARRSGVTATPALFVGDEPYDGPLDAGAIAAALEASAARNPRR